MAFTKITAAGINTTGNFTFGDITVTSIQTSDGSPIGGAGLGTAIDGNDKIYYTDTVLSIGSTTTINPPDSSNIAYTQYAEIAVEEGFDLIVEDGDDLVPDILGLSTETAGVLAGAGGRVRADNFTNKAGTGAPTFPNGVNVTGVVTATSFSGDGSALTGIDATSLKDSGDTIRVQANTSGAVVTGVLTATSFSGNVTGDVNAGVVTATSSIVVGDSFINATSIGIGTTTTAGRNAGVGTAVGTLIYNSTNGLVEVYTPIGWDVLGKQTNVISATGGTLDTTSRSGYNVHTFTSPGTFTVTAGTNDVEYLIIGGGGGGGSNRGGGGGAGALKFGTSEVAPGNYPITVGGGGGNPSNASNGDSGSSSSFNSITSPGGGGGGQIVNGGVSGGSGGGGGCIGGPPGSGTGDSGGTADSSSPSNGWGNDGGAGTSTPRISGGGGGAGTAGSTGGAGSGLSYSINGTAVTRAGGGGSGATNGDDGGGAGVVGPGPGGPGGGGNGGNGPGSVPGGNGTANTGSGGGGGGFAGTGRGGSGGSGIVIIAYPTS